MLARFLYHLKVAVWALRGSRSFTFAATGTLAIALSVFVAAISIFDSYLMRPLPYPREEEIVLVKQLTRVEGKEDDVYQTARGLQHWYQRQTALREFSLVTTGSDLVTNLPDSPRQNLAFVTPNLFPLLDVPLVQGRPFAEDEGLDAQSRVALISERAWKDLYQGAASAVGSQIVVGKKPYTIVGIVGAEFKEPYLFNRGSTDIWLPFDAGGHYNAAWDSTFAGMHALGRVDPGQRDAVVQEFTQLINDIRGEWSTAWPQLEAITPRLVSLRDVELGDTQRFSLIGVLGAAALLAIAVINVATLFMARAVQQAKSLRIRVMVGATRRQLLVTQTMEAMVVVVLALAISLACTPVLLSGFVKLAASSLPLTQGVALTWRVWLYAAALAGLLSGVFVLIVNASFNVQSLKVTGHGTGKGTAASFSKTWSRALIGLELYLIVTILALSGSALTGAARPLLRDMNWAPTGAMHLFVFSSNETLGTGEKSLLYQRIEDRLRENDAVEQIALGTPPVAERRVAFDVKKTTGESLGFVRAHHAGQGYFDFFGIPLLEGREFSEAALRGEARELIITEELAGKVAPEGDAVGTALMMDGKPHEVVGVAANINEPRYHGVDQNSRLWRPQLTTYFPMNVRVREGSALDRGAITRMLAEVDGSLMVWEHFDLKALIQQMLRSSVIVLYVAIVLACFGIILSAVGVWGITGYLLGLQMRELAVYRAAGMGTARFFQWLMRVFGPALAGALLLSVATCSVIASLIPPAYESYLQLSLLGSLLAGCLGLAVAGVALLTRGSQFMRMSVARALTGGM